ncbi:MAG TPA: hypothetical protein GX505_12535 [Clostridiales bacterium]|nr:hypothetical protein [Clostridiales bacterium]
MNKRKAITAVIALVLSFYWILHFCGCTGKQEVLKLNSYAMTVNTTGSDDTDRTADIAATSDLAQPAGFAGTDRYVKAAETDILVMYYNSAQCAIDIEDKRTGFVWSSSVKDDYYGSPLSGPAAKNVQSLFHFSVTDFDKAFVVTNIASHGDKQVTERLTDNGLSVDYYFPKYNVGWTVEFWLEGDKFYIDIPQDKIIEDGKHGIVSINMLPCFGASRNDEDGYIFYPDGSGALMYFKGRNFSLPKQYSFSIYGESRVDLDLYHENALLGLKTAMLPVFGLKRGENAFAAILDNGEHDAVINLALSGYIADVNRISAEFRFRKDYFYTTSDNKVLNIFEKAMIKTQRRMHYQFLAGDDANYSGMANAYRKYLLDEGRISKVIDKDDGIPLGLDLFMGVIEERLLFDKYITMTTFDQAKSILREFIDHGTNNILVNLIGWTQNGYGAYPRHLPPGRKLGGARKLKSLAEFARSEGLKLYVQDNFVDAYSKNRKFSKRNDTVLTEARMVISNKEQDEFLLNPAISWNKFTSSYIPKIENYGVDGISFERFGSLLYHDFHRQYPLTREGTAEYWNRFISETKERLGHAAAEGNAYVLPFVDRLFNIPVSSSGYFFTDESIPFYQMVVHGMIPYSSEPGNLFYDMEIQKLSWVEYGCMPYFELTYENSNLLKYTEYNALFSSQYTDWLETAVSLYKEFNERLGKVWPQNMISHERLSDGVYRVGYENGIKVYINYNDRYSKADGYEIPPRDYLVVEEGGNIR